MSAPTLPALAAPASPVFLGVTVWPSNYAELSWSYDGQQYRAVSNLDLRHAPAVLSFEDPATGHGFSLLLAQQIIDEHTLRIHVIEGGARHDGIPHHWPRPHLPPREGPAQYVVGWQEDFIALPTGDDAYEFLEALHRWWDAQDTEALIAQWRRAEAEAERSRQQHEAEQARKRAERAAGKPSMVRGAVRQLSRAEVEQRRAARKPASIRP